MPKHTIPAGTADRRGHHDGLPCLALVPKSCEGDQSDGDDPQHNIFPTFFVVGHAGSTPILGLRVKCFYGFGIGPAAMFAADRL